MQRIGRTTAGRKQLVCIVAAPENHWKLARYQELSQQRARVEGLTDETALQRSGGKARQWV